MKSLAGHDAILVWLYSGRVDAAVILVGVALIATLEPYPKLPV
jgi:hypothetical protein